MTKILFILLLLSTTVCNAQFVGSYSLKDGGGDVMSSQLCVLPNNEFAIASIEGLIVGKWEEKGANKIVLTEQRLNNQLFSVYGSIDPSKKKEVNFSFINFSNGNAYVSFSKDTLQQAVFQPLYDENSYYHDNLNRPVGDKYVRLATFPNLGDNDGSPPSSKEAYIYTFALPKKFTSYRIFYDGNVLTKTKTFVLEKEGDTYRIGNNKIGERAALTDKLVQDIKLHKAQLAKAMATGNFNPRKETPPGTEKILHVKMEIKKFKTPRGAALFPPKRQ